MERIPKVYRRHYPEEPLRGQKTSGSSGGRIAEENELRTQTRGSSHVQVRLPPARVHCGSSYIQGLPRQDLHFLLILAFISDSKLYLVKIRG